MTARGRAAAASGGAVLVALALGLFFGLRGAHRPEAPAVSQNPDAARTPVAFYPRPEPTPEWVSVLATGNVQQGQTLFTQGLGRVPSCQTCHGKDGLQRRNQNVPIPRLAGLSAGYVAEQILAYKDRRRGVGSQMTDIAAGMSWSAIGSAALYIGTLHEPPFNAAAAASGPAPARQLDRLGDNARALPACANCHGPEGRGGIALIPPIAGLAPEFTSGQLGAWKYAQHPAGGVMESISKRLTDQEINDLATYYSQID